MSVTYHPPWMSVFLPLIHLRHIISS